MPALEIEGGEVLTEGPAIVQYIADRGPSPGSPPRPAPLDRYRLQEWLSFISTELHKQFSPLFKPRAPDEQKNAARAPSAGASPAGAASRTRRTSSASGSTVADAYLCAVMTWTRFAGVDLGGWPVLGLYRERVGARPWWAAIEAERRR